MSPASSRQEWENNRDALVCGDHHLRLLGRFELRCGECKIELPWRSQRLVAFLGLKGGLIDRGYAAGTLWTRTTEMRAHASLRSSLWRIRQTPACVGVVEADRRYLKLADEVVVDVREHVELAKRILQSPIDALDVVADETLGSELLPDWYDDWVLLERERLNQLRMHALEALSEGFVRASRYADAAEAAFAAIRADPLRERSHLILIQGYLASGNRVAALRHYENYAALLERRVGLAPSEELQELMVEAGLSIDVREVPAPT